MTMAQFGLGAIGTISSWFIMIPFGRRTLYVYGLATLFVLVLIIGVLGLIPPSTSLSWGIGSLLLVYTFVCKSSFDHLLGGS